MSSIQVIYFYSLAKNVFTKHIIRQQLCKLVSATELKKIKKVIVTFYLAILQFNCFYKLNRLGTDIF